MKVMHDGRSVTVEVTTDGSGLVSHAGSALLGQVADKVGLTSALSLQLAGLKQRRRGHDPGNVIRDLAVMLADGGECVSDLGGQRDQDALFGPVASNSTAFRVVDRVASTPGLLDAVRAAHARARARFWELDGAPERLTIDVDATLITAHSEKEKAVRRVRLVGAQAQLFPNWRHYAALTNRTEILAVVEASHRDHANIELEIRDLVDQALAHAPSGQFNANAAWTVIAAIAHNLLRWIELLRLPDTTPRRAHTHRRRLLQMPGRLTCHARQITLHLPARWPWKADWLAALTRIRGLAALT